MIKPIIDAAPDVRQLALDAWKESGEKFPTARPAKRFDWMVEHYGYHPEEVQGRSTRRPAGWIHDAVMAQMDLQRRALQKEQ